MGKLFHTPPIKLALVVLYDIMGDYFKRDDWITALFEVTKDKPHDYKSLERSFKSVSNAYAFSKNDLKESVETINHLVDLAFGIAVDEDLVFEDTTDSMEDFDRLAIKVAVLGLYECLWLYGDSTGSGDTLSRTKFVNFMQKKFNKLFESLKKSIERRGDWEGAFVDYKW